MPELSQDRKNVRVRNRRVHMANERTFLAWIRTSVGIMAFGFVVEKFALFVRQISYLLGKETTPPPHNYSAAFGIFLVGLGAFMGVLAFVRYKKTEKQIDADAYQPSIILDLLLTTAILAIAMFLVIYLLHSL
ncbi:MAG TPA: DUF202 domain-containing protein [Dissulfurispiraceae bacterium]